MAVHLTGDTTNEQGQSQMRVGDAFGELALLYDTPRAATITALRDCVLWVLPRADFKQVTRMTYSARISAYIEFVRKIPCLRDAVSEKDYDMVAGVFEEIQLVDG